MRDVNADPPMFEGPCAGAEYSRIEVRNFAASLLAYQLEVKATPTKDWTPAQWAELRSRVKTAFERAGK
ncbi:MAG TPA: hypothetical protein VE981_14025 [Planctomycetota bacterium]|nr:hypothetical protein [Planctomycetota bacterium]